MLVRAGRVGAAQRLAGPGATTGAAIRGTALLPPTATTLGWRPGCRCPAGTPTRGALIVDPFCGTGTTLAVAVRLGRRAIGVDLSEPYCAIARDRLVRQEGLAPDHAAAATGPAQLRLLPEAGG